MKLQRRIAGVLSTYLVGIDQEIADNLVEAIIDSIESYDGTLSYTLDNWEDELYQDYSEERPCLDYVRNIINLLLMLQDKEATDYWSKRCEAEKRKTADKAENMILVRIAEARKQWELKHD